MTDTTILPCPFCGGDKVLISQTLDHVGPNWFAACHRATCAFTGYSLTEAEALTAWNTRANADARLVEALEEARTALSITRTNVMTEIGRCSDESRSPWAGVPEQLAKRIAKIDAALSEVSRG